jgi:hypothetical protein
MILLGQVPGPPSDTLSTGIGVAAVVLVAGWAITRWQRDRLRFALMKTALEKGVTRFPGTPPYWLVSLRQGVTLLALGIGLGVIGTAAWWLAWKELSRLEMSQPQQRQAQASGSPSAPSQSRPPHDDHDIPGGPHRPGSPGLDEEGPHRPPFGRPEEMHGPGEMRQPPPAPPARAEDQRGPGGRSGPPPGEGERGHRPGGQPGDPLRAQQTIGLVTVAAGFILAILGIVRIAFAKLEQRFARESDENSIY